MTLRELMDRRLRYVRRMDWKFTHDHLELDLREDGTYGELGTLRRTADQAALGMPLEQGLYIGPYIDTDGWEPWAPKREVSSIPPRG